MKKIGVVFLFVAVFVLNSCNVDHCDVDCNSGPLSLNFALLDKTTGENLFANGTFNPEDIQVLDLDDSNNTVGFDFISENDVDFIMLGPFGYDTKIVHYKLKVDLRDIFNLNLDSEEVNSECCSSVKVNTLEIKNANYVQNMETGVYEIRIAL